MIVSQCCLMLQQSHLIENRASTQCAVSISVWVLRVRSLRERRAARSSVSLKLRGHDRLRRPTLMNQCEVCSLRQARLTPTPSPCGTRVWERRLSGAGGLTRMPLPKELTGRGPTMDTTGLVWFRAFTLVGDPAFVAWHALRCMACAQVRPCGRLHAAARLGRCVTGLRVPWRRAKACTRVGA